MLLFRLTGCLSLVRFELVPVIEHVLRPFELFAAENVRVPQNELFRNSFGYIIDRKITAFCGDRRMEYDLKKQITKFLNEMGGVTRFTGRVDSVKCFVGLLQ